MSFREFSHFSDDLVFKNELVRMCPSAFVQDRKLSVKFIQTTRLSAVFMVFVSVEQDKEEERDCSFVLLNVIPYCFYLVNTGNDHRSDARML